MEKSIELDNTPTLPPNLDNFIQEIDAAVDTHMDWTRRVMRCAVLDVFPGEDVLDPLAHTLCHFGRWFMARQADFAKLNAQNTQRIMVAHRAMHDAIRTTCSAVLAGRAGNSADLDIFEQTQTEMIRLLAEFKTQILATAVRHDQLTGLPLRFGLEEQFNKLQKLRDRHQLMLYCAMIDIDHFKKVNDTYGHQAGDIALRHVTNIIKHNLRSSDTLFRFGGEEFLLLMLTETPEEATATAERLINALRDAPVPIPESVAIKLTVTMGISRAVDDQKMDDVIKRADKALYEGKSAGRDRYVFAHD